MDIQERLNAVAAVEKRLAVAEAEATARRNALVNVARELGMSVEDVAETDWDDYVSRAQAFIDRQQAKLDSLDAEMEETLASLEGVL